MVLDRDDWKEIEERLDDRYVMQTECAERQTEYNKKFANDDKRIEIISHDFALIKKLMWVIALAVVGTLVASVLELVMR
jgi:hypothetical protein